MKPEVMRRISHFSRFLFAMMREYILGIICFRELPNNTVFAFFEQTSLI